MDEPPVCMRCEDEYGLREGMDPSKYCDMCAQERVSELEPMLKKLRDFIEFGPFYGIEATNIVIEADRVLNPSSDIAPKMESAADVSNFEVLKRMSAEDKDIRSCGAENILSMKKVKAGTQLTFGVPGDVLNAIYRNQLNACLLIWDAKQFKELKAKMENESIS